jgi:two-component system OmpR family response regulator
VVEDHAGVMALAVTVLEHAGWRVLQARSVAEAEALLEAHSVEVVVSDVSLPGGTGVVPTYPADAEGHEPGVVYMSGDTARARVRSQPGTERARFLTKPFSPGALVDAVGAARSA